MATCVAGVGALCALATVCPSAWGQERALATICPDAWASEAIWLHNADPEACIELWAQPMTQHWGLLSHLQCIRASIA